MPYRLTHQIVLIMDSGNLHSPITYFYSWAIFSLDIFTVCYYVNYTWKKSYFLVEIDEFIFESIILLNYIFIILRT